MSPGSRDHTDEEPDPDEPRARRTKKRARTPERVTARMLLQRVAWLEHPIVAWPRAGKDAVPALPVARAAAARDAPDPGPAPARDVLLARLQNAPAGLYAIEKGRTSALPIDAALIGAANWALVQAASRKKDLQRIVGDVSRWTERAGALLPGITAAMQAIERGRSRPESLALEETALWVAGDHLRPSVTIATPLLRPFVDRAPVGKAGREGAAVVLARRMPAERLPSDLQPLGACALLLRSWGLDLILWTARALGGTDRLLAVARANPGLDDPYVARALLELAVGHPRCDLGSFLAALPALAEAVRGAPQAWTKRRALVLQMIDAIFEQTTGAARGNSAKAKRKRLRSMLTVPGGDRWERERELLDAALEYSGDPFGALDGVSRWYLGMSIPETMVKGALVAAGADVHGIRKELATRLGRFTPRPALDPGGFVERFTSIAARIAGEANAAALLRRIARWISHCISACAPGSTGDGGLHLAWRGLARLCSLNEPAPWSAPLLIEILAEHGDVLLERRIESAKHRKDGRFDATSAGVLTDHLTGDRHVSTVASLGFAAGVSRKDVRELIERDLLVQLGPVLYRDPSRLRPLFTWLRANPSLMQDTMSWATQLPRALFHWIDDPVLRGQAQRWCDHLFLRSGSSWDGVEGIFYEAFRETELHAFVAKNFFVIEAITDAAFAAAAKNPDSTASGFWRNSNALGVAWKWSALGHPDVAGMLSALLDAAVGGKIPSEKPYREAMLAIELSGGDVVRLLALLERASISAEDAAAALAGWEDLKKYPALGRLFRRWAKSKDRVGGLIRLLTSWAFATQLPARNAIKQALAEIDRTLTEVEGSAGAVDLGLGLLEELRRSAGTDEALPSAIREIVDHSGRLEAEREALRRRGASATGPQRARLMKLEALLEDRAAMERQTAREPSAASCRSRLISLRSRRSGRLSIAR